MKLHIYALKDKELNCFLNPYYTDTEPGNSISHLTRFLSKGEYDKAQSYRHRELYHLGVFDDERGHIDLTADGNAEFLLDCDVVLNARDVRERKEADGKDS